MASGKRKASIRAYVSAHHNVEDFRPYTFRFADRGSYSKNLEHMIITAIKKEGEWHGWFEPEFGPLRGQEQRVREVVHDLVSGNVAADEAAVFGYDPTTDKSTDKDEITNVFGLVIWVDRKEKNFGFGLGTRRFSFDGGKLDTAKLSNRHTDKYDNKWVSFK